MTPESLPTLILLILGFGSFVVVKLKIPVFSFIYGVLTIGITAFNFTNSDIVFSPYMQLFTLIMGALCMLYATNEFRS